MDCVILAAGKGQRLEGITAPYHKPLLVVNGKPLIVQAVDRFGMAAQGQVTIVVAPENAAPISQVLGRRAVNMVVQRFPDGPGDALLHGLQVCKTDMVLVTMGDNVIDWNDLKNCVEQRQPAVGVQAMDVREASRFTWLKDKRWVEGETPTAEDAMDNGMITVWCGPLVLNREQAWSVLTYESNRERELKIGPYLNQIMPDGFACVPSSAIDIGVPEMMP